jgi:hypothetical protein
MDYIFERIKFSTYDKEKCLSFSPFIQMLINHAAKDQVFAMDTKHKQFKLVKEINMFDPKKMEASKQAKKSEKKEPSKKEIYKKKFEGKKMREIMMMFMRS